MAIRALQAEVLGGTQLKWHVLVIQPAKNAREFRGKLEMSIAGILDGKPWMMDLPAAARSRCSSSSTAASKEWSICRLRPW